jgi:DNA-binding transcriptional MerR regulator
MTDTKWMTYAELAEILGIGGDSARNLVRRKRWPRQTGNDGLARVGVPVEYITESAKSDNPAEPPINAPADVAPDGAIIVTILASHISRLERELEALKQEREAERERLEGEIATLKENLDAERLRAVQVDALNAVIDAERRRVEDLQADRDRWAGQAEKLAAARSWWSKLMARAG